MTRPAWDDDLSTLCSDAPANVRAEAAARIEKLLSAPLHAPTLEAAAKVAEAARKELEAAAPPSLQTAREDKNVD